jgi:hypothetical protein
LFKVQQHIVGPERERETDKQFLDSWSHILHALATTLQGNFSFLEQAGFSHVAT